VDAVCSQGTPTRVAGKHKYIMDARRDHLKEALTALADVLAKRPAEEILFGWFRSGRLIGDLSVLIKRRHPVSAYALRPRRSRHSAPTEELGKA
jgi:hypothetical protein